MPQAKITINAVVGSNDDLPIGALVQLNNVNIGGELTYLWAITDQPANGFGLPTWPSDVLSSTTIVNPTFTPTKEGTYLISLTVNAGLPTQQVNSVIAAVRQVKSRERLPAGGETLQDSLTDGWALSANSMLRHMDSFLANSGVIVGVNGSGGPVTAGTVMRVSGGTIIKPSLPGQETVPTFTPALATSLTNVQELLVCMTSDVNNNTTAAAGALIVCRYLGRIPGVTLGGGTVGQIVFVDNTGQLDLTQGTVRRQVGNVMQNLGATQDVWFDGVGGADITPINAPYVVYGNPGTLTNAFRVDGTNASAVTGGVPFTVKAGDVSTISLIAQRFSNAGLDIQRWTDETGAKLASVTNAGLLSLLHGINAVGDAAQTTGVIGQGMAGGGIGGAFTGVGAFAGMQALAGTGPAARFSPGSSTEGAVQWDTQAAPTGANVVGQMYMNASGRLFVCVTAGTPGTFEPIGTLRNIQFFNTPGAATYTVTAGTAVAIVEVGGGGGAGAGEDSSLVNESIGGGGGSGGYSMSLITITKASYPLTIGSGAASAATTHGTQAVSGTATTFDVGFTNTPLANGGTGGWSETFTSANGTVGFAPSGDGGAVGSGNIIATKGNPGQPGLILVASFAQGGSGGPSTLGGAGFGPFVSSGSHSVGGNASAAGSGGGGAAQVAAGVGGSNGGAGGAGWCRVWEFG